MRLAIRAVGLAMVFLGGNHAFAAPTAEAEPEPFDRGKHSDKKIQKPQPDMSFHISVDTELGNFTTHDEYTGGCYEIKPAQHIRQLQFDSGWWVSHFKLYEEPNCEMGSMVFRASKGIWDKQLEPYVVQSYRVD